MGPLANESGGHRWQHIPATEKRGRVHTSTVTVACFTESELAQSAAGLDDADIEYRFERGRGKGGQKVNKVETCVVIRHIPTGIEFRVDGRNRAQNQKLARERLEKAVQERNQSTHKSTVDTARKERVGSGMRGDKIRTYRVQDGIVIDHRLNSKFALSDFLKGKRSVLTA